MIKELYFLVLKRTNLKKVTVSDEVPLDDTQHGTLRLIMEILMNLEAVSGVALINSVGSIVSSLLDETLNEAKVAAIGATILSVSERTCIELGHGKFNLTYIDGESGRALISRIGTENIIIIIFNKFSTTQEIFNEYFKIFNLLKDSVSSIP